MRVLVAVLLLVGVAACGGREPGVVGDTAPPERRAGSHGVTVVLPPGWQTMAADDGVVSDPATRIAVSSGPMRKRDTGCQIADYGPGPDAVALVVVEWQPSEEIELGPRPARFGPEELPVDPGTIECFAGSGGTAQFAERGRMFGAYLLLGPNAPRRLADEGRAVLETLRVESR